MKHLEFKLKYAKALMEGEKKLTIRKWTNLKEGDEVLVHSGGKIIGRARILSVQKKQISEITDEEAKLDGFRGAEELRREIERMGYDGEVFLIHFDFKPLEAVNPHNLYYGNADLEEIARKSLENLELDERERKVLEIFLKYGSIRKAARKLGGARKRGEIRKILRKCYKELLEKGIMKK
uniref:ASCH domain-containing protein n=1 Tax=Archaeoglobus fulgidus TaxID=2234 RepID=A0A7C3ZCG2_ARCFL